MQYENDGAALLLVEAGDQLEAIELVGHVEMVDRLVETDDVGLLRQHHGDPGALQLAARERADAAMAQGLDAGAGHGGGDRRVVARTPGLEHGLMRVAPQAHQLLHRHVLRRAGALRQEADAAAQLLAVEPGNIERI